MLPIPPPFLTSLGPQLLSHMLERVEEDFQMDYVGFLKDNFEEIRKQLRERREKGLTGFNMRQTLNTMMSGSGSAGRVGGGGRGGGGPRISLEELASLKRRLNSNIEEVR